MNNHNQVEQFILSQWVDELSRKLDRPREHILQYGLSATDFPLNDTSYAVDTQTGYLSKWKPNCPGQHGTLWIFFHKTFALCANVL